MADESEQQQQQSQEQVGESEGADQQQQQPDPIRNLKGEFNRKLSTMEQQLAQTNAALEQAIAALREKSQPSGPQKSAKDLLYEDPDRFVQEVEERAISKAQEKVTKEVQAQQQAQSVIFEMQSKFPEFAQPSSEAAQLAVEKAKSLPAYLRGTPEGARLVMMEAATELGLVPANKRQKQQTQSDDYVTGSRNVQSSPQRQASQKKPKVSEKTMVVAQLLGIDTSDPKRLEGLEKAANREKWTKYQ